MSYYVCGIKFEIRVMRLHKIQVNTPTKQSDAQPLVEREKQFECHPVEISRS